MMMAFFARRAELSQDGVTHLNQVYGCEGLARLRVTRSSYEYTLWSKYACGSTLSFRS